ncbi:MFS transporter [Streptomyces sp. NPDC097727]|uniref:MFS transporter n=1 Tax=Streptomyces sp. NPDC097727 TaxID=3366092 RepID=UPI003827B852
MRWGFGGGEWANAVMWSAFSGLYLYFFTDVVHGSPAWGGLIMTLGSLWNTVLQPYVGLRSDRLRGARGRRRPFLIASALPFAVTSWLLFTDFGLTGVTADVYQLLVVMAWFTSLTVFYVPYGAMGAELTTDSRQRTALSTVRTAFSQIGALVGAVLPLTLHDWLQDLLGGSETAGWSAAAAVVSLAATAGIVITWHTSRGFERAEAEETTATWRDTLGLLRSRSVRLQMGMTAFGWAPLSVVATVAIYFAVHVMGFEKSTAGLVMLVWFVSGLAWLPLVSHLTGKLGKKHTFALFTLAWTVFQSLFLLVEHGDLVLYWVLLLLSSSGSMAVAVTGWSMLADLTDAEQLRTGSRREGAIYGLGAFAQTGLGAIAVLLVGLVLSAVGYDGDGEPSPDAVFAIRVLMSLGAAVWMVPALFFCLRYPLSTQRHKAIRDCLETGDGDREALIRGL